MGQDIDTKIVVKVAWKKALAKSCTVVYLQCDPVLSWSHDPICNIVRISNDVFSKKRKQFCHPL